MSASDDPRIGTELGGFRIERLIGRGGMGVVYLAEQARYGRKVALKVLAPELASDAAFRERFEQEWRTAARIEHPNIVPIYEAGEADGVLYIAMRYVDGIDLNVLLSREGRLTAERAIAIVGQVGVALDAAHRQGLVHRDVKPGNILLADGAGMEGDHVYLTDFGVAKQTSTRSGLTRTGLFIGTIDYAAPEQIEGRELDGRADVYALGCVLYQCLTGALPFEKDSEVAMLYAHLKEEPPRLSERRPELPAGLDAVIAKALAKAPDERYASCRELVNDARAAIGLAPASRGAAATVVGEAGLSGGRTVVEGPVGAAQTVAGGPRRPWWRSRAALVGAGLVVVAAAGAGIGIALAGGGSGGGGEAALTTGSAVTSETAPATTAGAQTGETGSTPVSDPGAGVVAFSSQRDGDFDIYAMGLDGGGRVQLTADEYDEGGPRYSPDGSRVAFYGNASGDFEVYVMDADGSNVVQLTDNDVDDLYPAWSADGSRIAFTRATDAGAEIFAMAADGSGAVQLTANDVDDRYPTWSPDGLQIAFATATDAGYEIAVMSSDGGAPQLLTENRADDDGPDWSPDGSLIVFSSDRADGNFDIWTMAPDGTAAKRLATASQEDAIPRWVGDGSRIVFDSNRDGDFEIVLMNADGSGQTQLTDDLTPDYEPDASLEAVLPDGVAPPDFLADPQAFPNEREAIVLSHLPTVTKAGCERESAEDRAARAVAGVVCPSGQVTAFYDQFRTVAAMNAYYDRLARSVGAERGVGTCGETAVAEGTWSVDGVEKGRLLCYVSSEGRAVAVWTSKPLRILGFAIRPDDDQKKLAAWWRGPKSGPIE